jgi:hypothetical protein
MLQYRKGEGRQNGSAAAFAEKSDEREMEQRKLIAERKIEKAAMKEKMLALQARNNKEAHEELAKDRKERAKAAEKAAIAVEKAAIKAAMAVEKAKQKQKKKQKKEPTETTTTSLTTSSPTTSTSVILENKTPSQPELVISASDSVTTHYKVPIIPLPPTRKVVKSNSWATITTNSLESITANSSTTEMLSEKGEGSDSLTTLVSSTTTTAITTSTTANTAAAPSTAPITTSKIETSNKPSLFLPHNVIDADDYKLQFPPLTRK